MRKKKLTDHVRMGDNEFICEHCGDVFRLQMPISIQMFSAICKAFLKDHRHCPKPC